LQLIIFSMTVEFEWITDLPVSMERADSAPTVFYRLPQVSVENALKCGISFSQIGLGCLAFLFRDVPEATIITISGIALLEATKSLADNI
jgi:hypothetical protein